MPFAEEFINAFIAGQQARESKLDYQRKQRQMLFEDEDRVIEKEMLQHRMKELKIRQRLLARQAAEQNLNMLSGIPEAEVTPDMTEGGVLPARSATGDDSIQTLLKNVDIPGIEELGIPGIQRRPRTLESQLAEYSTKKRIDALNTAYNLAPGAQRRIGNQVIAQAPQRPEYRDINFQERPGGPITTRTVPIEEALATDRTRYPRPPSAGGGGSQSLSAEQMENYVAGIMSGNLPAQVPQSALGVKIQAELSKRGFNLAKANQDLRAMRTHFQTLNGEGQSRVRVAAEIADSALTELEDAQAAWQAGGRGILSRGRLSLALTGGLGPEAKQEATAFKAALEEVQQAIALLKSGGSQANNRALEQAEAELNSGANIPATIKRLRSSLQYRVAAIRNLEAITPTSIEQSNDADFDYDPKTGTLIPRKK